MARVVSKKTLFLSFQRIFPFWAVKLGHFGVNSFYLCVTNIKFTTDLPDSKAFGRQQKWRNRC